MTASNHAEIFKKVKPNAVISWHKPNSAGGFCSCAKEESTIISVDGELVDLLETDSNGNPTQQAKASALDVLLSLKIMKPCYDEKEGFCYVWFMFGNDEFSKQVGKTVGEAIYKAACEVLGLEVKDE